MSHPLLITKKGLAIPLPLEESLFHPGVKGENHFLWDGKRLRWVDLTDGILSIDFLAPQLQWRYRHLNRKQEPLLRALDWKSDAQKRLWDFTAGLGRDALLLLHAGFQVTMYERNPILQLLLFDACNQFIQKNPHYRGGLNLTKKDALTLNIREIPDDKRPHHIYLDPMYPERKKSALVKKELRIIRNLVGSDSDSDQLLNQALMIAKERVVVKRPQGAPYLADRPPHYSVEAPNTRYDIYPIFD